MNNADLTPVHVFTVIATSLFGAQMAYIVGPYIVIGIGAMGGAAVMIMSRKGDGNVRAFIYFIASAALAILLTVPVSMLAALVYEPIQDHWLFAPVSFGLGYLGDKWVPVIFPWIGSKISAFIDVLIATRGAK
mgnify:CR=1 FL=1